MGLQPRSEKSIFYTLASVWKNTDWTLQNPIWFQVCGIHVVHSIKAIYFIWCCIAGEK